MSTNNCTCCGKQMVEPTTIAEGLLKLADAISYPRQEVLLVSTIKHDGFLARATLALKLRNNPRLAFCAIMEQWTLERIVQEIY